LRDTVPRKPNDILALVQTAMRRLLVLFPLSLLLVACGGTSGTSSCSVGGPVLQTIQVSEKEYSLTPSKITVAKTGTYELKATNDGTITHALEIEGNGVEEKTGDVAPGSTATLRMNLCKDGSYEIYCPIDGHRARAWRGQWPWETAPVRAA
jgi:hypothetical protein